MHPDTREVAAHMQDFGLHLLGKAVYDATFSEMGSPFSHTLSIVEAAHGAEILIKARIAEEHPLLIFSRFPKSKTTNDMLSIKELFEYGQTLNYSELPEALWAATGYRIKHIDRFLKFGLLRNGLVHFAAPTIEASTETMKYAFEVIDPIIQDFWKTSFVSYAERWDDVVIAEGYLREQIESLNISVHPATKAIIDERESEYKRMFP